MAHRSASKLTFTPAWADMTEEERQAEQVAAIEIVAKYGGRRVSGSCGATRCC